MSELKITKEKVLEAANKCSEAKKVLETLFPEAFDEYIILDYKGSMICNNYDIMACVRGAGKYENKAIYLNKEYDWDMRKDDLGELCLIPTRK